MDGLGGVFVRDTWDAFSRFTGDVERDYYHFARGLTLWWSINVVIRNRHISFRGSAPKSYLLPRNEGRGKYLLPLRENSMISLSLFLYLYLVIYLSHAINNSACGRFLWLRNEDRAARARAFVARPILLPPPLVPMCCTTPNGIAPSCRGRIAWYNGPLHNGIRTCDVPRGRPSRWMLRTMRREEGGRQLRIFGDRIAQDFSRDTTLSCIKDLAFPHRKCRRFLFLSTAWHSRPFTTFWVYVWCFGQRYNAR